MEMISLPLKEDASTKRLIRPTMVPRHLKDLSSAVKANPAQGAARAKQRQTTTSKAYTAINSILDAPSKRVDGTLMEI